MTINSTTDDLIAEIEADAKNAEQAAFEEWLTSGRPQGDATSVHAQWEESSELSEHLDEWARFRVLINRIRELEEAQRETLKDLKWRIEDTSSQLTARRFGGDESLYGLDEWSTPIMNLATAVRAIDAKLEPPA